VIRDLGDSISSTVLESIGRTIGRAQERRPLPVDLLESDDAYLAVFDAPGALSSDVQVRYEANEVVVRIDRFREFRDEFEMKFPGRGLALDGRVELPPEAAVDPSRARATLKNNGTLQVRLPKVRGGEEAEAQETDTHGEQDQEATEPGDGASEAAETSGEDDREQAEGDDRDDEDGSA
jgi:HSP20 family molecular chaperone IbpA